MKTLLSAALAMLEGLAIALVSVIVIGVPAVLYWLITLELDVPVLHVLAGIAAAWLLGHGVPLEFTLSAEAALSLGVSAQPITFGLSLPLLGILVITAWGAVRTGWRSAASESGMLSALLGATLGFGLVVALIEGFAKPVLGTLLWVATLKPIGLFVLFLVAGAVARGLKHHDWWRRFVQDPLRKHDSSLAVSDAAAGVLRLSGAVIAGLIALASLAVLVSLSVHFVDQIRLMEALQLSVLGGLLVSIAMFALLPTSVLWALSWLSGAGFQLGIGSSVSPFEQSVGMLPAFPSLGMVPQSWGSLWVLAPVCVIVVVAVVTLLFAKKSPWSDAPWWLSALSACAVAVVVGLVFAWAYGMARGSIGPGRMAESGPNMWVAAGVLAAEVLLGVALGVLGRRLEAYWLQPIATGVTGQFEQREKKRKERWSVLGTPLGPGGDSPAADSEDGQSAEANDRASAARRDDSTRESEIVQAWEEAAEQQSTEALTEDLSEHSGLDATEEDPAPEVRPRRRAVKQPTLFDHAAFTDEPGGTTAQDDTNAAGAGENDGGVAGDTEAGSNQQHRDRSQRRGGEELTDADAIAESFSWASRGRKDYTEAAKKAEKISKKPWKRNT